MNRVISGGVKKAPRAFRNVSTSLISVSLKGATLAKPAVGG
jgi:hypothetical protein